MDNDKTGTEDTGTETITMTKAELEAKLQSESDRRVSDALKRKEREFTGKLKESEKLANMNAEEKANYERSQYEKTLQEKEIELNKRENRIEGMKILAEKNIPVSLIEFVLDPDATEMLSKINTLSKEIAKAVSAEVKSKLNTSNPKVAVAVNSETTKEQFIKMTLREKTDILQSDPELFAKLNK